jgi:hypothetical protein
MDSCSTAGVISAASNPLLDVRVVRTALRRKQLVGAGRPRSCQATYWVIRHSAPPKVWS